MKETAIKSFFALGTEIEIELLLDEKSESQALEDLQQLETFYRKKEKIFNRFDSQSEISKFNSNLGKFLPASSDMLFLANDFLERHAQSQGYLEPRILEVLESVGYDRNFGEIVGRQKNPRTDFDFSKDLAQDLVIAGEMLKFQKKMDFAGLAKGYIVDGAVSFLRKRGWQNFFVDSGGDVYAGGLNLQGKNWEVEIEGIDSDKFFLDISNKAIATSGITRRRWWSGKEKFHHLINPKRPNKFSFDLKSVTLVESQCRLADFWAKVLFLRGFESGLELAEKNHLSAIFLDSLGNFYPTEAAKKFYVKS